MAYEFLFLLGLAIALGFKHAYDPDHVAAVSNLITRSDGLKKTGLMSVSWALGHLITAAVITFLLFTFREVFLAQFLASLEIIVVIMLIVIGVVALLWEFNVFHVHEHWHGLTRHRHAHHHAGAHGAHRTMFSIGIVHGVASNDELLLLVIALGAVASFGGLLATVAAFSVGVVLGMIVFGFALTYPLARWQRESVRRVATITAAVFSLTYATLILLGLSLPNPLPSPI